MVRSALTLPERADVRVGPGLISAAANNDPTTVAALAVVGATTGYALCWLVLALIPILSFVQRLAAAVGSVSGSSLQRVIRFRYGRAWALAALAAVGTVNVITTVADVRAGSDALGLLTGVPPQWFIVPFALGVSGMLIGQSFARVEQYLSLVPLAFIGYAGSAVLAHVDVAALVRAIVHPDLAAARAHLPLVVALLGTTLTSYVYYWESIGAAERRGRGTATVSLEREAVRSTILIGVILLFIVIANATTLGAGDVPIVTATDAARALEPIAGRWSATFFALGLLGSAILVVPVLAATTAYLAADTFGWAGSLDSGFADAPRFYAVVLATLALAAALAFAPLALVPLLIAASIAGGVATPVTLGLLVHAAGDRAVMGRHAVPGWASAAGWTIAVIVAASGLAYLAGFTGT